VSSARHEPAKRFSCLGKAATLASGKSTKEGQNVKHYALSSFVPDDKYNGFHWPKTGLVERAAVLEDMPDPTMFHVLSLPCQRPQSLHWLENSRWVVLGIDPADYLEEDGFVDFQRGVVLFCGLPREACNFLRQQSLPVPRSRLVLVSADWEPAFSGDYGISIAGSGAPASAGNHGLARSEVRASVGYGGVAVSGSETIAGDYGFAVTTSEGDASAGEHGLAIADEFGNVAVGPYGVAIVNSRGTARADESGLAIARHNATAIAGKNGIAFAWDDSMLEGVVQAGEGGVLLFRWHDGERGRICVAHVGENGIKPDTPYTIGPEGEFVEVSEPR
jgi:hypothetical protein